MRKEKDSTNGNKRVVKNVVKVAGALAVVFVLFQIPTSIFSFQDSTNSDDHVKDYIITEIDTGEEVNTTEEETVEEAGAENVQYVEEQEEEVVDEYPVHNTERSSFSANDDTIPIVISDMMLETFGNTPTITLSVDNATDKDIKQALFLLYFYDDNGMPLVAMHWQHRFNHMVGRYNDIYRVQMPNITPHVCRHTYCSNMAKSGMNPKTLQYLMGHSDISVTMNVYTHIGFDDAEEELKRMEEFRKAQAEVEQKKEKPMSQKMFKVI